MTVSNAVYEGVRQVVVDNFGTGSITVEATPDPKLVELSLNADDENFLGQINIRQDGAVLRIAFPRLSWRSSTTHLRIAAPEGLAYVIKAGMADISIRTPIGPSKIITGAGDISIGPATDLDCSTGSGDISVARVDGRAARISSGSGSVRVEEAHCPVSLKSASGDLMVSALHRHSVQASSGSGHIAVPSTSGSADLRSASGSLTLGLADGLPAWLDLSSASGTIQIALDPTNRPGPEEPYVTLRAATASGDIAVYRA